jgi:beta-lactamase regulating signal transducer with metallopeptidase domain
MKLIQSLLTEPPFQALGWALVHFLWQGALAALVLAGCKLLLRRSTARVRYAISCLFLLVLLALPVLTFVTSMAQEPTDFAGANWVQASAAALLPTHDSPTGVTLSPNFQESLTPFLPWVVGIWIAGVILLSVRWIGAVAYLRRLRRAVSLPVPPEWERALQNLKRHIAVSAPVRLSVSTLTQAPSMIGWLRPVILLPAAALAGVDGPALEAVLAHELAHIRRHDYLVNLLQAVVDTLLFYHPAVWWVSKQIRIERENCCDDIAAEACGDRVIYARALLDLEQSRARHASFALAANGGSLLFRIQRLLRASETDDRRGPSWFSAVAGLAIVALVLAGLHSTARAKAEDSHAMESLVNVEESPAAPETPVAGVTQADAPQAQTAPKAKGAPDPQQPTPAPDAQKDDQQDPNSSDSSAEDWVAIHALQTRVASLASSARSDKDREEVNRELRELSREIKRLSSAASSSIGSSDAYRQLLEQSKTAASSASSNVLSAELYRELAEQVKEAESALGEEVPAESSTSSDNASDFLAGMASVGFRNLTVDELIDLKTHGVTPEFVRSLQQAGYTSIKPEQLIKLREHGVDARFMQAMKAGGLGDLPLDNLIELRSHGVTPDYIAEMKTAGFGALKAGQLIELRDHGVDGRYLQGLKAGGIDNLSIEDAIRLRDHGVDPKYITEMKDAGYSGLKAEPLIQLRDHGVDGEYVRGMKAAGLANLPLTDLVRLRDHGVTPDYINQIKTAGYGSLSSEQYERLRDNGVDGAYIRKLNQNGLHNLSVQQIIRLRQAGI